MLSFRSRLSPAWLHGLVTLVIGFAAVGIGASAGRIITRHLVPNVLHVILVWIINNIPAVILLEAMLGYIGVGVTRAIDGSEFTVASWGGMFFSGRHGVYSYRRCTLYLTRNGERKLGKTPWPETSESSQSKDVLHGRN
jgi:hypothetical protein